MKRTMIIAMISMFGLLASFTANAQPGNPATPAPLGFVELLLGGGAALGARKIMKERKKGDTVE